MLEDEDDVEEHREEAKTKLDRIAAYLCPVARASRIEQQLSERENASREIEQDIVDVPAIGAATRVVEPNL
eukprot:scaffold21562_cov101-Isochrysis_galbana.AAC.3